MCLWGCLPAQPGGGCGGQGGRGSIHTNQPPLTTTPLPWGLPQVPLLDFITGTVTVHVPQWPSGLHTQSPQPPAPLEKDRAQASAQSHVSAPLEGRGTDTGTPHSHVHGTTLGPGLRARGRVSAGTGAIVLALAWVQTRPIGVGLGWDTATPTPPTPSHCSNRSQLHPYLSLGVSPTSQAWGFTLGLSHLILPLPQQPLPSLSQLLLL